MDFRRFCAIGYNIIGLIWGLSSAYIIYFKPFPYLIENILITLIMFNGCINIFLHADLIKLENEIAKNT